ncbi:MAG: glutamine-hydrolyzing GMP synthase [Clostridiales bacterium]|nr:glutamine-hydrolyzing GMP synthase [Clostridiales bacterium]
MNCQTVLILDFGGQYKELIARRVRECGVYSIIKPYTITKEEIEKIAPIGMIFTGGPNSVYAEDSPVCDPAIFELGIPLLGICYGMQLICHMQGGKVDSCEKSEYGAMKMNIVAESSLFKGMSESFNVLMSHTDRVYSLPSDFKATASTDTCPVASYSCDERKIYGVQFHPEVEITENGTDVIRNFLYEVCGALGDYSMADYLKTQIAAVRERVDEDGRILLGLSGGVDSSVCAALLSEAVGDRLVCIYIDHGLMRKNETDEIRAVFEKRSLNFVYVDAEERFLTRLKGVTDPEQKRKIIGDEFVRTFEDEAKKQGNPEFLAQGTIYPDIVESGANKSAVIKSHHNVGGLPEKMSFKGVIEPLSGLFKDEVRKLGIMLGLPETLVQRQPFPGPGLAIRIIGEITKEKCDILRDADAIFRYELMNSNDEAARADQYFAVLTDTKSVGVMGDFRTYDYTLALRAVRTSDFMTCEFARLPYEVLARASSRITNEVSGINRVVYDVTSKPPATIEWE